MIAEFLDGHGIRVLIRRTAAFDVPDFLAGGPRELLVAARDHELARELVASHFGLR